MSLIFRKGIFANHKKTMDINELRFHGINRHPYELSRTKSILRELNSFFKVESRGNMLDVGAGDMFFDNAFLETHPGFNVFAVDIGYNSDIICFLMDTVKNSDRITAEREFESIDGMRFDLIVMLDSLEYFDNDLEMLKRAVRLLTPGGLLVISVPAFRFLFSEFDIKVKNKRRYNTADLLMLLKQLPEVKTESVHFFYISLFFIRMFQKIFGCRIDKNNKIISHWKHPENTIATKAFELALNIDYEFCRLLSKIKLYLPGLSLIAICEKNLE